MYGHIQGVFRHRPLCVFVYTRTLVVEGAFMAWEVSTSHGILNDEITCTRAKYLFICWHLPSSQHIYLSHQIQSCLSSRHNDADIYARRNDISFNVLCGRHSIPPSNICSVCSALLCLVQINNPHWIYMMYLTIFFRIITVTLLWFSQWTLFIYRGIPCNSAASAISELSSYPGYFRESHWNSMGLPEISRVNIQACNFNIGQTHPFDAGCGYKCQAFFVPHKLKVRHLLSVKDMFHNI